jgi:sRNA-binding carbon storage regulator CsrA
MLVLSRRLGESIFIGDDIEVVLIDSSDQRQSARFLVESAGAALRVTLGMTMNGHARFVWLSDVTKLTLLEVKGGNKVRVGIDSPRDVKIWRGEIRPQPDGTDCKNGGRHNGVGGTTVTAPIDGDHQRVVAIGKPSVNTDLQKGRQDARNQEAGDDHATPDPDFQV